MATPLSADRLLKALRDEGVRVVEYRDWRTHERDDETGKTFGPVHGVLIHHTAGRDSLALCYEGRSDLPGPLCTSHLSKAGTCSMISGGRSNHAGTMARNAYDAMVAESSTHPRPDSAEPIDGNDCTYGLEIENLGDDQDPYPDVQYDQAVRWAAAICRAHGWTEHSVIGHKEATRRKVDPSFSMDVFRARVAERLAHTPSWSPGGSTPTPKPPEQENDMPDARATADEVWRHRLPDKDGRHAGAILRSAEAGVEALRREVAELRALVQQLVNAGKGARP